MKYQVFTTNLRGGRAARDQTGSGIVGSMFGAIVFLAFVSLAAHALIGLYASSVVSSVSWEQASSVAREQKSVAEADQYIHSRLNGVSPVTQWNTSGDVIELHVLAKRPSLLPRSLAQRSSLTSINKTIIIRKEEHR